MKNESKNIQFLQMNLEVQEMSALLSRLKTICGISTAHLNFLLEQYENNAVIIDDSTISLTSDSLKPLTISKDNQGYILSNSEVKEMSENQETPEIQNWVSSSRVYNPRNFYTEIDEFIKA